MNPRDTASLLPRRWQIVVPVSVLVLLLAHFTALTFRIQPAVSLWFPPSGVAIALTLWFGPLGALLAGLTSTLMAPFWGSEGWTQLIGLADAAEPLVAWLLYRCTWHGSLTLNRLKDAAAFTLCVPLVACATSAVLGNAALVALGKISADHLITSIPSWWLGNAIGTMAITPTALIVLTPFLYKRGWLAPESGGSQTEETVFPLPPSPHPSPAFHPSYRIAEVTAILIVSVAIAFLTVSNTHASNFQLQQLSFLSFVPIIWAATRFGVMGGMLTSTFCVLATLLAYLFTYPQAIHLPYFPVPSEVLHVHKLSLLVQCGVSLLVGCAVTEQTAALIAVAVERVRATEYETRAKLSDRLAETNSRLEASNQEKDEWLRREQAAREQVSEILESIAEAFFTLDRQWCFTYVNQQATQLLQKTQQQLLGHNVWDLYEAGRGTIFEREYQRAVTQQIAVNFEAFYAPFEMWVEVRAYPSPKGLSVFFRDISLRRKLEQELYQRQQEFVALIEHSPDIISRIDRDLRIIYINPALETATGLSPYRLIGKTYAELPLSPEKSQSWECMVRDIFVAPQEGTIEFEFPTVDGTQRYYQARIVPEFAPDGSVQSLLSVARDITDLKETEAALRSSEARLRRIIDSNIIGIFFGDANGKITDANEAFLEILGYTQQDVLAGNIHWNQMTPPAYVERTQQAIEELTSQGIFVPFEKELIRKDGSHVFVLIGGALLDRSQAEGVCYVIDISDRKQAEAELYRREQEFKALLENSPDIIARLDRHFRHLYVNPAIEPATGLSPQAFIGKTYAEVGFPEEKYTYWQSVFQEVFDTGKQNLIDFELPAPSGKNRSYQSRLVPEFAPDGSVSSLLILTRDLTDFKRALAALAQSELRYMTLAEALPAFIFTNEPDGRCNYCNQQWYDYTGSNFEAVRDWGWLSFLHSEDRSRSLNQWMLSIQTRQPFESEYRIRGADGIYRWFLGRGLPMENQQGEIVKWIGTCIEIDTRKRAEETLRYLAQTSIDLSASLDYEATLQTVTSIAVPHMADWCSLETIENGVIRRLPVTCANPAKADWAKQLQQYPPDLSSSHPIARVLRTGKSEVLEELPDSFLREHTQDPDHLHLVQAMGMRSIMIVPLVARGRILGTLTLVVAESDRRYTMADLTVAEDLARRAALAIDNARVHREAQDANRIKDEFLAVLSHELRSPLNPILGWVKLLRTRKFDAAKTLNALETIERNAQLQIQLIDDLLDVSRILRGKLTLTAMPVNLAAVVNAAIETVRLAAEVKSISIQFHCDLEMALVVGDAGRLQQVVWNLLSNAIKFTEAGGQIQIWLFPETGDGKEMSLAKTCLRVSDTGIGISPEFLPYVFEHFRQADASITRKHGGLGLGLAIARHLVELHGGTMRVESGGLGQGATFIVQLPLMKDGSGKQQRQNAPSSLSPDRHPLAGVRAIVVDDETDSRDFISFVLEDYGAQVVAVSSASQALTALLEESANVLVSDIGMPEEDGYSLIRKVRLLSQQQGGRIPAIALTAYAREEDSQQALAAGFQIHLPKPVEPEDLVVAIARLLKG